MQGGTLNCQGFPCKQNIVSPNSPPAAHRTRSNGGALVAKGEMDKAAQATGAPKVNFINFMPFMVKCICISSVCSASSVVKLHWPFFVNFRVVRG